VREENHSDFLPERELNIVPVPTRSILKKCTSGFFPELILVENYKMSMGKSSYKTALITVAGLNIFTGK